MLNQEIIEVSGDLEELQHAKKTIFKDQTTFVGYAWKHLSDDTNQFSDAQKSLLTAIFSSKHAYVKSANKKFPV